MATLRIAVLADLHFGPPGALAERRSEIADLLLDRAIRRLNRLHHPDITVVLGDVLDDGTAAEAPDRLRRLRELLAGLEAQWLILPGNHDGPADCFYQHCPRPPEIVEVKGVRLLPFVNDPEEPGYNARRTRRELERFRMAREGFGGPLVALQHVCLAPPQTPGLPYNYVNAAEIIEAMRTARVRLSLSGHFHPGLPEVVQDGMVFVNAPALCEAPFAYLLVTVDGDRVTVRRHTLAMPADLGLVDGHVHTPFAYCSENLSLELIPRLAADFGLAGLRFAEHSGQLYFSRQDYWGGVCLRAGLTAARPADDRMAAYVAALEPLRRQGIPVGLEVDCDFRGEPVLRAPDRKRADHLIGAIHSLPSLEQPDATTEQLEQEFLDLLARFLQHGFPVLAHPFRCFQRAGRPVSDRLIAHTVELLQQTGTAAELNCHTETPPVEFVRLGLDRGLRFSLGSDAHNLCEIGDFAYQLSLLEEAGFHGDLRAVLTPTHAKPGAR